MGFYKKWLSLVILCFCAFTKSSGSVVVSINGAEPDTLKIRQLLDSGKHYLFKPAENKEDLDKSLIFLNQAIALSDSLGLKHYKFEAIEHIGINYLERRNINEARKWFIKVSDYYQKIGDRKRLGELWLIYGNKIPWNENSTEALYSFRLAAKLFEESNNRIKEIEAMKQIANLHLDIGQTELAERELFEVLENYKDIGYKNLHYTYDLLSVTHRLRGDLKGALRYGLKSVESMETTKDTRSAPVFYSRIAHTYRDLGNIEKSIEWYIKEIDIFINRDLELQYLFRDTKFLISLLILQNREYEALSIIKKIDEKYPHTRFTFEIDQNYALVYQALGNYDLSEKFFVKMLNDLKNRNYVDWITAEAFIDVGKFYLQQKEYSKAKYYLAEALKVKPGMLTMANTRDIHLSLFKVDSTSGDYLLAINHLQQYNKLNDSLINETRVKEIEKLQIEYETAKKEQNISLLTNQSELQKMELAQSRNIKNLMIVGLSVLIIFFIILYYQFKIIQNRNKAINKKNGDLEGLIEEKEWLNKEIHHRVKNNLQIVISLLNTQSNYLKEGTAFDSVTDSRNRMQAMSLIHQKLYLPQGNDYIDIVNYINELVNHLQESYHSNHKINLQTEIDSQYVGVAQATPLGLILNEAISNIIKYAYPTNKNGTISISLKNINDNDCMLQVSDDGVGLPIDFNIKNNDSLGLSLIKGLSKQLGGTFELISDVGVRINVVFPKQRFIEQESIERIKKIGLKYEY